MSSSIHGKELVNLRLKLSKNNPARKQAVSERVHHNMNQTSGSIAGVIENLRGQITVLDKGTLRAHVASWCYCCDEAAMKLR